MRLLTNWKTSLAGFIPLVLFLLKFAGVELPEQINNHLMEILGASVGIGLLAAPDADKTVKKGPFDE